ncbi:MAG: hypothetical protein IPO72_01895 [Saprospiraceae bacterium]|nr:hypothetical protein [Candidatus Vicinibacter affinis]MBK6573978.1 hypothetical protein [Candidatus Vicinibacter affinis]MBK7303208.1 hypothetical protein [Candidatus Vicinibacter affinis]MBK7800012.1 hypothetical protein [Candidatus Vicinibacter affinis]MBK8404199.1 hypothetical protein [Candidatus Vicinibacter affinis]
MKPEEKFEFNYEGIVSYFNRNKLFAALKIVFILLISIGSLFSTYRLLSSINLVDVNGIWILKINVQSSSYLPFKGMDIGYKIFLSQSDNIITGNGEKYMENGNEIPFTQHVQIEFVGKVEGKKLFIQFKEYGKKRTSLGSIELNFISKNLFEGNFTSTAANSKGKTTLSKR